MTRIELLDMLTTLTKRYRMDAKDSLLRNNHMNEITTDTELNQRVIDAVLVDFINYVGMSQGLDYGIYTIDLHASESLSFWERELFRCDWLRQFSHQVRDTYDGIEIYHYKLNSFDTKIFYIDYDRTGVTPINNQVKLHYCLNDTAFRDEKWVSIDVPLGIKELKKKLIEVGFNIE